jgi:hypothetical protein
VPAETPPGRDEKGRGETPPQEDGKAPDERRAAPPEPPVAALERRIALQVGDYFGLDVRPSRTFAWIGRRRPGNEIIVSLGAPPSVPRHPLEEHTKQVGVTEITYAGSPAVTVPLTAYRAAREALRRRAARKG